MAGNKDFIKQAWRFKHLVWRRNASGRHYCAAGVYALRHHVDRLQEDHDNARLLARGLAEINGISVEPVETNILLFDVGGLGMTAAAFCEQLLERGVRMIPLGRTRIRAVTHLDVSRTDVEYAVEAAGQVADRR